MKRNELTTSIRFPLVAECESNVGAVSRSCHHAFPTMMDCVPSNREPPQPISPLRCFLIDAYFVTAVRKVTNIGLKTPGSAACLLCYPVTQVTPNFKAESLASRNSQFQQTATVPRTLSTLYSLNFHICTSVTFFSQRKGCAQMIEPTRA